jgi:hypothetical protein
MRSIVVYQGYVEYVDNVDYLDYAVGMSYSLKQPYLMEGGQRWPTVRASI